MLMMNIDKADKIKPGSNSYILKKPPMYMKFGIKITKQAPVTTPDIAPIRVILEKNNDNSINGPKEAPMPAHA